jgi:hypothetical protein
MLKDKTLHPKTKDITTKSLHHKIIEPQQVPKFRRKIQAFFLLTLVPIKQTNLSVKQQKKIQNFISKAKDKTTKSLKHNKRKPNILRNNPKSL